MAAFNSDSHVIWMEISHRHDDLHLLYCSLQVAISNGEIVSARDSPQYDSMFTKAIGTGKV